MPEFQALLSCVRWNTVSLTEENILSGVVQSESYLLPYADSDSGRLLLTFKISLGCATK